MASLVDLDVWLTGTWIITSLRTYKEILNALRAYKNHFLTPEFEKFSRGRILNNSIPLGKLTYFSKPPPLLVKIVFLELLS